MVMHIKKFAVIFVALFFTVFGFSDLAKAAEQPTAIFHAFNQQYQDIESFVCILADQGYSHIQISPAQQSNPGEEWWRRYQPFDYSVIEGLGSEDDLRNLINTAHSCNVKVIGDVVFNHMADLDGGPNFEDLSKYPGLTVADFHTVPSNPGQKPCDINYSDGNRDSELNCWLGTLPDLEHTENVKAIQKAHLKKLLDLGIDGFRFDAAKHMPREVVQEYINYINEQSAGESWNYLEVITDADTTPEDYNDIAAITDFILYGSMKNAYVPSGDLRSLPATAINDPRSVTFGINHDTIREVNNLAIDPYENTADSYLASAYVLAREDGTPLIFNQHNLDVPYLPYGVKFRKIIEQRGQEGRNVQENILRVIDSSTISMMERGGEGFLLENKGTNTFDIPVLDLTPSNLQGCYRELRYDFQVSIGQGGDGRKYVTAWGRPDRGGVNIGSRNALYFIRQSEDSCSF